MGVTGGGAVRDHDTDVVGLGSVSVASLEHFGHHLVEAAAGVGYAPRVLYGGDGVAHLWAGRGWLGAGLGAVLGHGAGLCEGIGRGYVG